MTASDSAHVDEATAAYFTELMKENRAYMRHIEQVRLRQMDIYLVVCGAVFSLFALGHDSLNLKAALQDNVFAAASFLFLYAYGLTLSLFVRQQKRGYEQYREDNRRITEWFVQRAGAHAPAVTPKVVGGPEGQAGAFAYWHWTIVLLAYAMLALAALAATAIGAPPWAVLAYFVVWGVMLYGITRLVTQPRELTSASS